jgi:hypothetical protein
MQQKKFQWLPIVVFLFITSFIFSACGSSSPANNPPPALQKFQGSPISSSAFQIYPGPLSDQATQAVAGFNIDTKILPDGSVQVNLTSTNPEYTDQHVVVKPGYTLYFIEKSTGDDSPTGNTDQNLRDDATLLVDPQGFIVQ